MSFCFAFGEDNPVCKISQIYAIEYIEYRFKEKPQDTVLKISGDFFFPNFTKEVKRYYFMHRGDMKFVQRKGSEVTENGLYTDFLRLLYAPSLSATLSGDEEMEEEKKHVLSGLYPYDGKCNSISLKDASMFKMKQIDTKIDGVPLLSFYSVEVPPENCAFVRVEAYLEKEGLGWLTNNFTKFEIYGGDILLSSVEELDLNPQRNIFKSDQEGYNQVLARIGTFKRSENVYPARYDIVLWPKKDSSSFRSQSTTDTLIREYNGIPFGDITELTWYRTSSPTFNVFISHPNDLHIDLEAVAPDGSLYNYIWKYR